MLLFLLRSRVVPSSQRKLFLFISNIRPLSTLGTLTSLWVGHFLPFVSALFLWAGVFPGSCRRQHASHSENPTSITCTQTSCFPVTPSGTCGLFLLLCQEQWTQRALCLCPRFRFFLLFTEGELPTHTHLTFEKKPTPSYVSAPPHQAAFIQWCLCTGHSTPPQG